MKNDVKYPKKNEGTESAAGGGGGKNKNWTPYLIGGILGLILVIFGMTNCWFGHKWSTATYTAPKTCLACGKTEGNPLRVQDVYPKGILRFKDGRLLMNTEELLALYEDELNENGLAFRLTNRRDEVNGNGLLFYLENAESDIIQVSVITDEDTGLISLAAANVLVDAEDLDSANDLLTAATILYETCHGAMSDEKWDQLNEALEYTVAESGIGTRGVCDGLGLVYHFSQDMQHYEVLAIPDMTHSLMQ